MTSAPLEPEPIRVVLDCNVFIDAAAHVGPGRGLSALPSPPPPVNPGPHPAAQTLTVVLQGVFAEPLKIIPCISDHIINTTLAKLKQPPATRPGEEGGLGWSDEDALAFVQEVVNGFDAVGGIDIDVSVARDSPPLKHEDGMVMATVYETGAKFFITSDGPFRGRANGQFGIVALSPRDFVTMVSSYRSKSYRGR